MSDCWVPSDHTYTGDCLARRVLPHYATMPDRVRVFDRAVRNQGWTFAQKKLWRKARDSALPRWEYPVEVIELRRRHADEYRAEGITLDRYVHTPPYGPQGGYGGFGLAPIERPEMSDFDQATWDAGKGYALIHDDEIRKAFAGNVTGTLAGLITHEVGHALGFGHGGIGVMRSVGGPPYHPSWDELTAMREYWGRA